MKKLLLALLFVPCVALAQKSPFITNDRAFQASQESRARTNLMNEMSRSLQMERNAEFNNELVRQFMNNKSNGYRSRGYEPSAGESAIDTIGAAALQKILENNAAGRKTRW